MAVMGQKDSFVSCIIYQVQTVGWDWASVLDQHGLRAAPQGLTDLKLFCYERQFSSQSWQACYKNQKF